MKNLILLCLISFTILACTPQQKEDSQTAIPKAQEVVNNAIEFHGMSGFGNANFSLTFRDYKYTYTNKQGAYEYTRAFTDSIGANVYDVLTNNGLTRTVNGDSTAVDEEKRAAYSRSVNSVIYFFRLPYGLNDDAVNKTYNGTTTIKDKTYHEVKITFAQEGGGEDFDDVFLYWFDTEDYSMDYLAYLYHTDGGGLRFREAINQRRINGALVQDYINYKPADETVPIDTLANLYNKGNLEELSRIMNEEVKLELN
ncbi:DUF6503 family protein [Roseivirga pacifica]|uniref:DUF6503 family protein n=1 Tax=Roseivirga pacifica TaxID=1267423 RepID=UPI003BAE8239